MRSMCRGEARPSRRWTWSAAQDSMPNCHSGYGDCTTAGAVIANSGELSKSKNLNVFHGSPETRNAAVNHAQRLGGKRIPTLSPGAAIQGLLEPSNLGSVHFDPSPNSDALLR